MPKILDYDYDNIPEYREYLKQVDADIRALNTKQRDFSDFTDRQGRTWEWFIDKSYYHMTCVRLKGETDFNSPLSFHFNTSDIASEFVNLLKQSS